MRNILSFVLLFLCTNILSQNSDLTSAIIAFQKNDLDNAKVAIDKATIKIESGSILKPKKMAKYYHYRGLIYFRKFQVDSLNSSREELLDIATNSFLEDAKLNSSFSKKSISQLRICANTYSASAYEFYQKKEYNLALKFFVSAVSIQSSESLNNLDINTLYGAVLSANNAEDYLEAIKWGDSLIQNSPDSAQYHIALIDAYEGLGDLDGQLNAIKNARSLVPKSQDIIFKEVNYYISSGNNELLLESLENAISSDPNNAVVHFVLGSTYSSLNDFVKAISSYETAISLDENYSDAYNNLAAIYLDEANVFVEKQSNLPVNAPEKKYSDFSKKIKSSRLKALPYLERVLMLQPTDGIIIETLKQIYYQLDMDKKSLQMKTLKNLPKDEKASFVQDFFTE
tara:strand:+ start:151 stop:1347 length:1197 start_codon:yes stop_codon:yes gene_type:complete